MERPWRPASEHFQPAAAHAAPSRAAWLEGEEEEDCAPIFSLSKSSMDVLMAAGPPHKRDPAWTRLNMRRSSSTNTHAGQNTLTLQQMHARTQWCNDTSESLRSLQGPPGSQRPRSTAARSEHWISNVERWSVCSGSARSGCSTPESVVWRGGSARPWSNSQETPGSSLSKLASPASTPSPFISPMPTPALSPTIPYLPSPLTLMACARQQGDAQMLGSTPSDPEVQAASPLWPSPLPITSPESPQLDTAEGSEGTTTRLINHSPSFPLASHYLPFPSSSSLRLEDGGGLGSAPLDTGFLGDGAVEPLPSLNSYPEKAQSLVCGVEMPADVYMFMSQLSSSEAEEQGPKGPTVCHLELPWEPGKSGPAGLCLSRRWRSPLMSSLSDSGLENHCKCKSGQSGLEDTALTSPMPEIKSEFADEVTLEEGTMTTQLKLVDVGVQTVSPPGSWWNLMRNMSYLSHANMDSHSVLGSPPGSKLNLRSSLGSNSNLVSPSSSMFPADSGGDEGQADDPVWEVRSPGLPPMGRRRSCLKGQVEERSESGEMGRRGSMKQVQWDEDGMTWDVHGTSLDPKELTMAIQRHLNLKENKDRQSSPPLKKKSKKKTAPKVAETPLVQANATASPPEPCSLVTADTASSMGETEVMLRPEVEVQKISGTKKETAEDVSGQRKSEEKGDGNGKESNNLHEEKSPLDRKSASRGSGRSLKMGVPWSLMRPGWCGSSSKADE